MAGLGGATAGAAARATQATPKATAPTPAAEPTPAPQRSEARAASTLRYGISPAPAKKAGTLRLASYNLENFFDDVDDPSLTGDVDDAKMTTTDARAKALAQSIRDIDADVLCLQEVESLDALRWFRDHYLSDMGYDHLASDDVRYYRGIEQSVMSRFPIVRQMTWPDADLTETAVMRTGDASSWQAERPGHGDRFQRSPLFAQVRTPDGYMLDLFVVHHKAGGKDFAFHREAEALKIISLIKERLAEDPGARLAVLGDFNASPSEKSVKIYMDPDFGDLVNAWEQRFDRNRPRETFVTHASGRVIDYIFVNKALADDLVPRSFFVYATATPPEGWNWRTDPHPQDYASDHRPVVVDLLPKVDGSRPAGSETRLWKAAPVDSAVPPIKRAPRSADPPSGAEPSAPAAPTPEPARP